jgi:hypothetical protein
LRRCSGASARRNPSASGRQQDQMDVVRHQAPRPDRHVGRALGRREQVAVERIVVIAEERSRASVATLRHVVRVTGNNDTGKACRTPDGTPPQRLQAGNRSGSPTDVHWDDPPAPPGPYPTPSGAAVPCHWSTPAPTRAPCCCAGET